MIVKRIYRDVHQLSLVFSGHGTGHGFVTSMPESLPIDGGFEILNEIESDWRRDFAANKHVLTEKGRDENYDEFMAFARREQWRIGSYIVYACSLDKVLEHTFNATQSFIRDIERLVPAQDKELRHRFRELTLYRRYRNKVFAHPAAVDRDPNDNISVRATSLGIFGGNAFSFSESGVAAGGFSYTTGNGEQSDFPAIYFDAMVNDLSKHYSQWILMFERLMRAASSISEDVFKAKLNRLEAVKWRDPTRPNAWPPRDVTR